MFGTVFHKLPLPPAHSLRLAIALLAVPLILSILTVSGCDRQDAPPLVAQNGILDLSQWVGRGQGRPYRPQRAVGVLLETLAAPRNVSIRRTRS